MEYDQGSGKKFYKLVMALLVGLPVLLLILILGSVYWFISSGLRGVKQGVKDLWNRLDKGERR